MFTLTSTFCLTFIWTEWKCLYVFKNPNYRNRSDSSLRDVLLLGRSCAHLYKHSLPSKTWFLWLYFYNSLNYKLSLADLICPTLNYYWGVRYWVHLRFYVRAAVLRVVPNWRHVTFVITVDKDDKIIHNNQLVSCITSFQLKKYIHFSSYSRTSALSPIAILQLVFPIHLTYWYRILDVHSKF